MRCLLVRRRDRDRERELREEEEVRERDRPPPRLRLREFPFFFSFRFPPPIAYAECCAWRASREVESAVGNTRNSARRIATSWPRKISGLPGDTRVQQRLGIFFNAGRAEASSVPPERAYGPFPPFTNERESQPQTSFDQTVKLVK